MLRRAAAALAVLFTVSFLAPPSVSAAAVSGPKPIKIVQIGDSYSAGNGAGNYYGPRGCYRSKDNWAERYVRWLKDQHYAVTFINRACSGAVTANLTSRRFMEKRTVTTVVASGWSKDDPRVKAALTAACITYPEEETAELADTVVYTDPSTHLPMATATCSRYLAPQVDAIGKDTDLVLFTIGGNDVNFAEIVKQCFAVGLRDPGDCRKQIDDAHAHLPAAQTGLVNLLTDLHTNRMRPDAKVAMLTYPYLSDQASWKLRSIRAIVGFGGDTYDAGAEVRKLGDAGDAMQRTAINQANKAAGSSFATLVDTVKSGFAGHEPDPSATHRNPDRWIHEFDSRIQAEWYHPNDLGHEEEKNLLTPYGDFGAAPGDAGTSGSIDLVFAIDTTGSMQSTLDQVKLLTGNLVDLLAAKTSSYRFALVTYRDQPAYTGWPGDYASRVDLPFTTDKAAIHDALSAMVADGGGDYPESVYSGLEAALSLPWRPGVKKVVIQIGDAPPHDPEPVSNLTAADVIKHALAVDPAAVYPLDVSGGNELGPDMATIAAGTGGEVVNATSADIDQKLLTTITGALAKPYAWAGGPYVAKVGTAVDLDASGSFDSDGTIAKYEWDFNGDGTYDETTTGPLLTHTFGTAFTGDLGLRVTDNDGNTAIATAHLAITGDGDEVPDAVDNCPDVANPGQEDTDGNGIGDACDSTPLLPTADKDGVFEADAPGTLASSEVSGVVYRDANGNDRRDAGEPGIQGVTMTLTGTDAGGLAVSRTVTTGADGAWSFTGLLPGTYQVTEAQPAGLADGSVTVGTVRNGAAGASPGAAGTNTVHDIVLSGVGSAATGYAFGEKSGDTGGAQPAPGSSASPSASPAPAASGGGGGGALPRTGERTGLLAVIGLATIVAGAALLTAARRRRRI